VAVPEPPPPPPPPPVLAERAPAPAAAPPRARRRPRHRRPPPHRTASATAPAAGAPRAAGNRLRLLFDGSSSELNDGARSELQQLAAELNKQSNTRIQLLAYAEGTPTTLSQARRLSLDRALTVRSFLANQGVNTRASMCAHSATRPRGGAPANRVDLLVMQE